MTDKTFTNLASIWLLPSLDRPTTADELRDMVDELREQSPLPTGLLDDLLTNAINRIDFAALADLTEEL